MKHLIRTGVGLLGLALLPLVGDAGTPRLMQFQGTLSDSTGSFFDTTVDMTFTVYDAASGGATIWTESQSSVAVSGGVFSVLLGSVVPLADTVFADSLRFLGIQVGGDPELDPRQRLVSTPYAQRVATVDGARGGVITDALEFSERNEAFDPPFMYLTAEGTDSLSIRKIFSVSPNQDNGIFFYDPTVHAFNFGSGPGISALHIEPLGQGLIGINTENPQSALDVVGTLRARGVELGVNPTRSGFQSTIGGGGLNTTSASWAVTAGGQQNTSSGQYATVSGGHNNVASGQWSTVPGGDSCEATADHSFAAGRRSKAQHEGAFVWGDHTNADIASTAIGQFQVRATGGANIFSSADLSTGVELAAGSGTWASVSDRAVKQNIRPVSGEEILASLADMPVSRWSYKAEVGDVEHIGPMAQDFYAAFGLGNNDRHITTVDADGVALAAIRALLVRNQDLKDRVARLEQMLQSRPVTQ